MTTRIGFYHLVRSPLEKALPQLVQKALQAGARVLVMAGSAERVEHLDSLLWTFDAASWVPHGTARDGDADLQPVFITDSDENPNNADMLFLTDGVVPASLDGYARCFTLFDGNSDEAVQTARDLWKAWKGGGFELTYYQQTEQGGWQEKARAGGDTATI
jgi:DNA polymerase-3 subunit chi